MSGRQRAGALRPHSATAPRGPLQVRLRLGRFPVGAMGAPPLTSLGPRPAKRTNVGLGLGLGGGGWAAEGGAGGRSCGVAGRAARAPLAPHARPRRGAGKPTSAPVTRPSRPITGLHPREAGSRGRAGGRRSTTPSPVLAPPRAPLTCRGRSRAATAAGETTAHAHTSGSGRPAPSCRM